MTVEMDMTDVHGETTGKWRHVKSAHAQAATRSGLTSRKRHFYAGKGASVAGQSLSSVGHAGHLTHLGVAGAAVLGAGTAGIGLAVAGGVMTVANAGFSGLSAYKTNNHLNNLAQIRSSGSADERCICISDEDGVSEMSKDHDMISSTILPYIIAKKKSKLAKKTVGAFGLSPITNAHKLGRAVYKKFGVLRASPALITHTC